MNKCGLIKEMRNSFKELFLKMSDNVLRKMSHSLSMQHTLTSILIQYHAAQILRKQVLCKKLRKF